jgi:hypothetical protein
MPIVMPNRTDQNHAPHREPESGHEAVRNLRRHGPLGANRVAEIETRDTGDEAQELLVKRPVESKVLADELDRFRVRVGTGGQSRRSPGNKWTKRKTSRPTMTNVGRRPSRRFAM